MTALLRSITRPIGVALLGAALVACRDTLPVAPEAPRAPEETVARLSLSDPAPLEGTTFVVAVEVRRPAQSPRVASFIARITFDSTALEVVATTPVAGVMTAINATPGFVSAAGATATGIDGAQLFAVRFRALKPGVAGSLTLAMDELNDVTYASRMSGLRVLGAPTIDRTLK